MLMQKVLTGTSLRRIIAAAVSAVITVMCPISYVGAGGIAPRTEGVSAESGSDNANVLLDIDYDTVEQRFRCGKIRTRIER